MKLNIHKNSLWSWIYDELIQHDKECVSNTNRNFWVRRLKWSQIMDSLSRHSLSDYLPRIHRDPVLGTSAVHKAFWSWLSQTYILSKKKVQETDKCCARDEQDATLRCERAERRLENGQVWLSVGPLQGHMLSEKSQSQRVTVCESIFMTFSKWQHYGDGHQTRGCQDLGLGEGVTIME